MESTVGLPCVTLSYFDPMGRVLPLISCDDATLMTTLQAFAPIDILYRTQMTRKRPGPYGALMRHVAAHPVTAGCVGGLIAIGIALARGWKGASAMPEAAVVLCALVLVVWAVIFYFTRGFFARQTTEVVEVVRKLHVSTAQGLLWTQTGGDELCVVERPLWRICRASGEAPGEEHPWCVWVIVTSQDDEGARLDKPARFVLETRVMWQEARRYPMESHERDELLPSHVASPLLELARPSSS